MTTIGGENWNLFDLIFDDTSSDDINSSGGTTIMLRELI